MLTVHAVKAFQDNYIWLIQAEHSQKVLIVDPGDADPVLQRLAEKRFVPIGILVTHHHADHIGGIQQLLQHFTMPVFGPAQEQIPFITQPLQECGDLRIDPDFPVFRILETPGHTAGHICYLVENKLFCGDTLFAGGCGRLLGGSAEQLFRSLQRLKTLPADTEIYCAHEYTQANLRFASTVDTENTELLLRERSVAKRRLQDQSTIPSTLAVELATNPFFRTDDSRIKKAAETYSGRPLNDPLAVFTVIRSWKDRF